MNSFIKNTALLLAIFNLFSFTTFADLKTGNNFDLGNSTGVIVPLPGNEKEEQPDVLADNNTGGGGGSYRPSTKPTEKPEPEQEPVQPENNINTFTDVKQDDWFYSDVMFVFNNKIMTGTGENEFSPDTTLNRAMMITILHRIDKDDSIYEKNIFNDVEKNSWYETAVNWGYENKIVTGTGEKTFAPMDNLTREQLCVMLYNYTKHIGVNTEFADISSYTDEEMVSDWAKEAVTWAVHEKIVTGKGNNSLAPQDSATRAETAAVIRRYAEKFVEIEEK
ncbi:MAG: S-layer homology domain-containing protein [Clostridia bacterium]|nr:S-layer homology domain-containing protein [Clostridia bacterium]